jgi:DNA methylase
MGEPYWSDGVVTLHLGDCLTVLRTLEADSVDAIVTDPPAAIAFMGREWDGSRGGRRQWVAWLSERMAEAYRVLKPGGHALVWSIPRTSHWTAWAIEDAGFDVRDCVLHLFGSGFPKSHNVSVAIDKALGAEREVVGEGQPFGRGSMRNRSRVEAGYRPTELNPDGGAAQITAPATEEAARWAGFGTALKPGQEMWWLARKPMKGTVAANVLEFGTGALNIDGCRVAGAKPTPFGSPRKSVGGIMNGTDEPRAQYEAHDAGRWPANIVLTHSAACEPLGTRRVKGITGGTGNHDGSVYSARTNQGAAVKDYAAADGTETVEAWACAPDCPVGELDRQSGVSSEQARVLNRNGARQMDGWGLAAQSKGIVHGDSGGASRFYPTFKYQAKAPSSERPRLDDGTAHETVKPLGFMRWAVRLITPPGGTVLDMFAGSGPVGEVAIIEGFRAVLIEQDPKSAELIKTRLRKPIQPVMFGMEAS